MMEMQHSTPPISKGMKNYRLNSTAADSITDEDVANTLADMPDEVVARGKMS